jgi:hypothetical protein
MKRVTISFTDEEMQELDALMQEHSWDKKLILHKAIMGWARLKKGYLPQLDCTDTREAAT